MKGISNENVRDEDWKKKKCRKTKETTHSSKLTVLSFKGLDQLGLLRFGRLAHRLPKIVQNSFECEPLHGGAVLEKHAADAQLG